MPRISAGEDSNQCAETPPEVFLPIQRIFNPGIDLAADSSNSKCDIFIGEQEDSLSINWHLATTTDSPGWCNHPYENCTIWIRKAHDEAKLGATVIQLQPLASHRVYYRKYVKNGPCAVVPISRSVKFLGYPAASPVPFAYYIWNASLTGGIFDEVDYLDLAECDEVFSMIKERMLYNAPRY